MWSLGDTAGKARRLYSYLQAVYYAKPYNQLPHTAEHRSRVSRGVSSSPSSSSSSLLVCYICLSVRLSVCLSPSLLCRFIHNLIYLWWSYRWAQSWCFLGLFPESLFHFCGICSLTKQIKQTNKKIIKTFTTRLKFNIGIEKSISWDWLTNCIACNFCGLVSPLWVQEVHRPPPHHPPLEANADICCLWIQRQALNLQLLTVGVCLTYFCKWSWWSLPYPQRLDSALLSALHCHSEVKVRILPLCFYYTEPIVRFQPCHGVWRRLDF